MRILKTLGTSTDRNAVDRGGDGNFQPISEPCITLEVILDAWPDDLSTLLQRRIEENQRSVVDHARELQSL